MKKALKKLFEIFRDHHKQLYIVGGAVRDILIGEVPEDYDLTTDALPDEMETWFEQVVSIGKKFGTIGIILDGEMYEVTTFRKETSYVDGRHPEEVIFTDDMREDVSRRDFTINGLLMDEYGSIFDYNGGLRDIDLGMIRSIGDPKRRLEEDRLRKWRCIRLASEKRMEIEKNTRDSIEAAPGIDGVSMERVWSELSRIMMSEKVTWGGYLLVKTGLYGNLLSRIIPIYVAKNAEYLVESFEIMAYLPKNLAIRLAALILKMNQEERQLFLSTLRCGRADSALALKYCRFFMENAKDTMRFKKALAAFEPKDVENLFLFQRGVAEWRNHPSRLKEIDENERIYMRVVQNKEPLTLRELAVNGDHLKALGYSGSLIGDILEKLLEKVYRCPEDNTKDKLLAYLERDENGKTNLPKSD